MRRHACLPSAPTSAAVAAVTGSTLPMPSSCASRPPSSPSSLCALASSPSPLCCLALGARPPTNTATTLACMRLPLGGWATVQRARTRSCRWQIARSWKRRCASSSPNWHARQDSFAWLAGEVELRSWEDAHPGWWFPYRTSAGAFFQANTAVAELLLEGVLAALAPRGSEHVLDLYCGVGLFTVPVGQRVAADRGRRVQQHRRCVTLCTIWLLPACRDALSTRT